MGIIVVRVKGSVVRVMILTIITILLDCHYVCILRNNLNQFNSYVYDFSFILRRSQPMSWALSRHGTMSWFGSRFLSIPAVLVE